MNNKSYECCIFDLDGTLLDTSAGLLRSLDYTIAICNLPPFPEEKRLSIIGPPIRVSLQNQYHLSDSKADKALAVFREYYESEELFSASLYPGIPQLLARLRERGIKLALGTYKMIGFARDILAHFEIEEYFNYIGGADPAGKRTKTDILNLCLAELTGGNPDRALMVGDSQFDARAAAEAGIDFLAVTYGFGFKTQAEVKRFSHVGVCHTVEEVGDFCG